MTNENTTPKLKIGIIDTEHLGEAIDDLEDATGSEIFIYDSAWAKAQGLAPHSPEAFMAAVRDMQKQGCFAFMCDSFTDISDYPREVWASKNKGKKIPYGTVDMEIAPLVRAMKASKMHWVLTMRESDDKGPNDEVIGKKAKAAKDAGYAARFKVHCRQTAGRGGQPDIEYVVRDQRGLGEEPAKVMKRPKSSDFIPYVERYAKRKDRQLHATFYGRDGSGKSGGAMRMLIALCTVSKPGYTPAEKTGGAQ